VPEMPLGGWRRIRDRPLLLERERELAVAATAVEDEQRRLAAHYAELRRELVQIHELLWAPDRDGPYRKTRRPNVPGPGPIPPPVPNAESLYGRDLRRAVLRSLTDAGRSLTLTEIHRALHLAGHRLASEHPVKRLGDALAYEERKGRVRRVARGTYEAAR
jgi:hypothetical protein